MSIQGRMQAAVGQRFKGKVAVVTGGTAGIGLAIAERLGAEGAHVVVCSRRQPNVDSAVEYLKARGIRCDGLAAHVAKSADRAAVLELAASRASDGKVDVLVSNVACSTFAGQFLDTPEASWDKMFEVNLKAAFLLTREAVPYLKYGSSVVYVSSMGGYEPTPLIGAYTVTKTALLGLVKVVAKELLPAGIRVNGIAPGVIKTKLSSMLWEHEEGAPITDDERRRRSCPDFGCGGHGVPHDCSGAVAFLCSPDARFITGETLVMSGLVNSRL